MTRFRNIALALLCVNAFLLVSRVLDIFPQSFKLPAILLTLLGIALLASKRVLAFWKAPAGKILPIFVAWVFVCWFVSARTAESTPLYLQFVLIGALLFAAAAGLPSSVTDFSKLMKSLAAAGLVAALMGTAFGRHLNGRFALPKAPYSDPNYYALWLLAVVPIIWAVAVRKPILQVFSGVIASALPLFMMFKTGSRASVAGMLAMILVIFFFATVRTKVVTASVVAIAFVLLVAFIPNSLRSRFSPSERSGKDDNSTTARETLFVTSIAITLANPIFGVGPGNFGDVVVDKGRAEGHFDWVSLNTHNAYTQLSSETGIPGIVLYLLSIAFTLKDLIYVVRRSSDPELKLLARGLLVSLAGILSFIVFLSEGYNLLVLLWLGIANGMRLVAASEPVPALPSDSRAIDLDPTEKSLPNIEG